MDSKPTPPVDPNPCTLFPKSRKPHLIMGFAL